MTFGLGLVIVGMVMLYAGFENMSIGDVLTGAKPPPHSGVSGAGGTAAPAGADASAGAPGAPPAPAVGHAGLLVHLGFVAESMGLRVSECDAPGAPARWGPVHHVHVAGSLHYQHRAFDTSGSALAMIRFGDYCLQYAGQIAELIHNGGPHNAYAVKNGRRVSPSVYAAVWAQHANHVHVGV